jgi:hypothetical protein
VSSPVCSCGCGRSIAELEEAIRETVRRLEAYIREREAEAA